MKRVFMCLSIAILSIAGLNAQENKQSELDMRTYKQQQEQMLQEAIRTQTQQYTSEAAKRMQKRKSEVQNDLEARRLSLMYRPDGMVKLQLN